MNNQITTLQSEGTAELKAQKAIQTIFQIMEDRYPVLSEVSKSSLIRECLLELTIEKKLLQKRA
jgi:hypothetical protein